MTTTETAPINMRGLPPLTRKEAAELGRVEYLRFADALASLEPADWARDTDCDGWTVRDLAGHLCGAVITATGIRAQIAEQKQVKSRLKESGENEVDAMTAIQIAKVSALTPPEIVAQIRSTADAAAAGRRRPPALMAKVMKIPVAMNTIDEKWSLDYLLGTILTRDTWLHRVADLARAVDRAPVLDAHDQRIVGDVAREWASRHGQAVELVLTGPAGGHYVAGDSGPVLELDAVEFCRIVSRRSEPTHPLLETEVPF